VRDLECSLSVEMDREPQLIAELLGKPPGRETVSDTGDEPLTQFRVYFAVFQTTAHHCPRPPMPNALRVREDELDALLDCANLL
jgi:hypothetical protein